jgi:hypothetical protein
VTSATHAPGNAHGQMAADPTTYGIGHHQSQGPVYPNKHKREAKSMAERHGTGAEQPTMYTNAWLPDSPGDGSVLTSRPQPAAMVLTIASLSLRHTADLGVVHGSRQAKAELI